MNEKKFVAHFVREYIRPTETFIVNQINTLKRNNNFEPILFCKKIRDNHNFSEEDFTIIDLNKSGSSIKENLGKLSYKYFRYLDNVSLEKAIREIKTREVKILHFHYLVDARFYIKVMRRSGLPSVVSVYGYDVSEFTQRYFGLGIHYLKPILDETDYILAMSNDMKNDLVKIGCQESKIIVHYHGINVKRFTNKNKSYAHKGHINILFCGQLTYKKAPLLILKALKIIEEKQMINIPIKLTFIGDGPLRNALQAKIKEYNLESKVNLLGHVLHDSEILLEEYRKADIFVLPSMVAKNDKEGIPGTLIEAMASGLPVISTYHAGIPEIIKSGENGLLIEEGDFFDLAIKICELVKDTELRKRLGLNSMKKTEELTLEIKTRELEEIYTSMSRN